MTDLIIAILVVTGAITWISAIAVAVWCLLLQGIREHDERIAAVRRDTEGLQ